MKTKSIQNMLPKRNVSPSYSSSNTLKGLVILLVLMNHYLNKNVSGDSTGYACIWVAIFFFLSGYGIANSLKHRFPGNMVITKGKLFLFYFDRFARLYPLLWFSLLLDFLIMGKTAGGWEVMGINGKGHYWFISSLLPCYLFSPVFFRLVVKFRMRYMIYFSLIFVVINWLILYKYVNGQVVYFLYFVKFKWLALYFTNLLIFNFGIFYALFMHTGKISKEKLHIKNNLLFFITVFSILLYMFLIKTNISIGVVFYVLVYYFGVIAILLLSIFSLKRFISICPLAFLGSISYPIYLFHTKFYYVIEKVEKFPANSVLEFFCVLLLFPVFLFFCIAAESVLNFITNRLRNSLQSFC